LSDKVIQDYTAKMLKNRLLVLQTSIIGIFYFYLVALIPSPEGLIDLAVYFEAGQKALAHQTVYDVQGHFQFKYSPFIAYLFGLFFYPFSFAELGKAYYFFNVLAFLILKFFFVREIIGTKDKNSFINAFFLTTLFYGFAISVELNLGQINILPFALLFLFYKSLSTQRRTWLNFLIMSTFLSVAIQIKLYSLIVMPFLLFRREYLLIALTFLNLAFLSLGALVLIHSPEFALSENIAWVKTLTTSSSDLLYSRDNISLLGIIGKWTNSSSVAYGFWVFSVLAFLFLQFKIRKRSNLENFVFSLTAITLINPLVWIYWIILTIPMFLQTLRDFPLSRHPLQIFLVIFVFTFFFTQHTAVSKNGGAFISICILMGAWLYSRNAFFNKPT
jgi:hypothetical protein